MSKPDISRYQDEGDFWSRDSTRDPSVMLFKDRQGLTEDLKYVISVPDLCDVKFLVGKERSPVYGVRAVLATRSRMFYQLILARQTEMKLEERKKTTIQKVVNKLRKMLTSSDNRRYQSDVIPKLTIEIDNFDVRVFERVIRYVHSGIVAVDAHSVIGMMNAAYIYEFPELRKACWDFALQCLKPETLVPIFTSVKNYSHFKGTRMLMQKIIIKIHESPELVRICQQIEDLIPLRLDEYIL